MGECLARLDLRVAGICPKNKGAVFIPGKKAELPQHNHMFPEASAEKIVTGACTILDLDIEAARHARRMLGPEKDKRDMIMYLLREKGGFSNQRIGEVFNLTYSSVSRRLNDLQNRFQKDKQLANRYPELKSKINV